MTEPAIPHTPGPWEIVPTVHSYRKHIFHRDPINAYYIGTLIAGSPHIPSDLVVDQWTSDGESGSHRDFLFLHGV
jgi:hypothetical protein